MTWSEIKPPQPSSASKAPVKVSMARAPRSSLPAKCNVVVSADLAKELGWTTETPLKVWLGDGNERGWAMIVKNGEGAFRARDKRGALSIRLGEIPAMGSEARKAAPAEYEIKDKGLCVKLFDNPAAGAGRTM